MNNKTFASAVVLTGLVACSCGGEGGAARPAPLLQTVVDASTDAPKVPGDAAPDRDAAPEAAAKPRRTVYTRDPFGNYARAGNLLLDGDFEWLGGYMSQYPWLNVTALGAGFEQPTAVIGVKCRSGLKCAALGVGEGVAGIGLRAQDADLKVSAWMRPPAPDCLLATVSFGACFHGMSVETVPEVSATPDAQGWCHYEATVAAPSGTPCVFVSNDSAEDTVILDDVVVERTSAGGSNARRLVQPRPGHLAMVASLRDAAREFMRPKPPQVRPEPVDDWMTPQ